MEYKGFKLKIDEDIKETDDNGSQLKYYIYTAEKNGENFSLDFSGYDILTEEEFKLFVDLNFPDRYHNAFQYEGRFVFSPLKKDDLLKLKEFENIKNKK